MSKQNENKRIEEKEIINKEEILPQENLAENRVEDIPKDVKFENSNVKKEEGEKIPDYFISAPKTNKEAVFGVKNGRTYKRIDAFTGVYTDTGEGLDLRK